MAPTFPTIEYQKSIAAVDHESRSKKRILATEQRTYDHSNLGQKWSPPAIIAALKQIRSDFFLPIGSLKYHGSPKRDSRTDALINSDGQQESIMGKRKVGALEKVEADL